MSDRLVQAATELAETPGAVERIPGNFHLYAVRGSEGIYRVALKGERRYRGYTITQVLCPCKAGSHAKPCRHAVAALIVAREAGHIIDLAHTETEETN
jgi:uncharacterized Zn finger protein